MLFMSYGDTTMYFCWFDDSKRPLGVKITEGIEAYEDKFHTTPTVLLVNSTALDEAALAAGKSGMTIVAHPVIRRNYLGLAMTVSELLSISKPI